MQIDLEALPDDPATLQGMLCSIVGEQDAAAGPDEQRQQRRAARPRRNHGALPAHLPRFEVVIDVADKTCPCCSGTLHLIGEDLAEQLDIVPAQLRVRVTRRPRYGCRACEGAVVQAPAPDRLIDGGMATEALVAHIVVSKFCDHHREAIPRREHRRSRCKAAVSPGRDAGTPGRHPGPLDVGQLGGTGLLVADTALRSAGRHGAVLLQGVRRRHDVAGAGPRARAYQDGAAMVLRRR